MFELIKTDAQTSARMGRLTTSHGQILTPCFMPVATQATVKALPPRDLLDCGSSMILSNAYHLFLRPGIDLIKKAGGLHKFMGWNGGILTDSGGYQVFSLALLRKINDEGVDFQSHFDGQRHFLTPEKVVDIQLVLGSDVCMPLDECAQYPCPEKEAERAVKRTSLWARRSKDHFKEYSGGNGAFNPGAMLFAIVQGATYETLRRESAVSLTGMDFDGYALGGLSVGESADLRYNIISFSKQFLPEEKPRYLMGMGTPLDIITAVAEGMDMFDCVIPTRYGRSGTAFTSSGKVIIRNACFSEDFLPLDDNCGCYTCRNFSRAYLRHLFNVDELLGLYLVSLHNVYYYQELMRRIRASLETGTFSATIKDVKARYS